MSSNFDSISDITPEKESWTIVAKVVRLWLVPDFNKQKLPFSMELVLMDDKGDKIHASIRRTLIYKWDKDLREGFVFSFHNFGVAANGGNYRTTHHKYKLNLQFGTIVEKMGLCAVRPDMFQFVPIPDIVGGACDPDFLVDVMGFLTGFGTEKEIERNGKKSKINVIAMEADGHKIECTLFGSFVDDLNTFLASGAQQNAVVIIQLAKIKSFQDKIHLQNCINCTNLIFNPDCHEAVLLRDRMIDIMESPSQGLTQLAETGAVGIEDDFLQVTPSKTIEGLKDCKVESSYVVLATVKHIIEDDWWYTACMCTKAVYPDHKMFFCEKCNRHVMKVVPRYRIKVRVIDDTDSATFVIFDREAKLLFNQKCVDMFETHNKTTAQGSLPKQIADLVENTFLFKVEFKNETSSKFEKSFVVKRICNDQSIINKFNDLHMKTVDVNSENEKGYVGGGGKQTMVEGCGTDLAQVSSNFVNVLVNAFYKVFDHLCPQNLLPKFSTDEVDNESQCGEGRGYGLSKDSEDLTPLKRVCQTQETQKDLELPLKMLKKNIKIEKD